MTLDIKEVSTDSSGYLEEKERAVQSFWDATMVEQQGDYVVGVE